MTEYTATVRHHSIAYHPSIECGSDLAKAKRLATQHFGDGFRDHFIVIYERTGYGLEIRSERRIGSRKWVDHQE